MISCMESPWAVIRKSKSTGEEFIDMTSLDNDMAVTLSIADDQKLEAYEWDAANPVIRISRCVLVEATGTGRSQNEV